MGNPIVHFEINGPDAKTLQGFYGKIFGWTINADNPMNYGMVEPPDGRGIGGGIADTEDGKPETLIYVAVDDVDASLAAIEAAGGERVAPKVVIPGMVTYAKFRDPQGNLVGLVENDTPPTEDA